MKETNIQSSIEAGGKLQIKSALNPALWMCAIVTMPICIASIFKGGEISYLVQIIAAVPVALAGYGFYYLLKNDRDKLQSEDFQIKKKSLELIHEKSDSLQLLPTSIESISNMPPAIIDHTELKP